MNPNKLERAKAICQPSPSLGMASRSALLRLCEELQDLLSLALRDLELAEAVSDAMRPGKDKA